jgi:hypothetical protein
MRQEPTFPSSLLDGKSWPECRRSRPQWQALAITG